MNYAGDFFSSLIELLLALLLISLVSERPTDPVLSGLLEIVKTINQLIVYFAMAITILGIKIWDLGKIFNNQT